MADKKYVIAFDLGTSGEKAILMDSDGRVIASERRELHPCFPKEGWAESDPVAWWNAACDMSKDMIKKNNIDLDDIVSVGFDAPSNGFVPVTKADGCIYPSIIWLDARSGAEADEMNAYLAGVLGIPGFSAYTGKDNLPKMRWIQKYLPEVWEKMESFLSDTGYMVFRATGEFTMSYQDVISFAYDFEKMGWDYDQLALAGTPLEKLPKIMNSSEIAGYLTETAAAELGLKPGLPVTAGFSDCSAVELGLNSTKPGDASLYIGTSMLFGLINDDDRGNEKTAYNFPSSVSGHKMYLITNDFSGGCIDWIVNRLFNPEESGMTMDQCYAEVDKMLDATQPGANRLFFSTWFAGERQPICDNNVRAGFWNLNPDHSRAHMVRAVYEGLCYEIRWSLSTFEQDHGYKFTRLPVAGGGAKSDRLMQILADVTGITIDVLEDPGFCIAKGTGYQSFIAAGTLTYDDVASQRRVKKTFYPREEFKETYDRGAKMYAKYYETVKDFFAEVNG